jgi:CRISPR system Cascade subunit CasD
MIGLIASAQGRRRVEPIDDLTALRFTIRVDRPGERIVDFHTVGGGLVRDQTVPTSEGSRRPTSAATIVSRRAYLADAVFTVCADGPPDVVDSAAAALRCPYWAPFLGRRSCPAETPLVLRHGDFDGDVELRTTVPLSRPTWESKQPVTFVYDRMPTSQGAAQHLELNDEPLSFNPQARRYAGRAAYIRRVELPEELSVGVGGTYVAALLSRYPEGMS